MSVLDRSWYGRVLVERIEGFATAEQWGRAFEEIVQFERMNALEGVIIVKFWLQISAEEQLKRFNDRQNDPLRRSKSPKRIGAIATRPTTTWSPPKKCSNAPTTS